MKPCHFYISFNPLFNKHSSFKTQAHEFYYSLKSKIEKNPAAFMYWGKLRMSEYSEDLKLDHFEEVLKNNQENGADTILFVSDYHHLWAGRVAQVSASAPALEETLPFYQDKKVEVWFKITDFDLISNDAQNTTNLLAQLSVDNKFYSYKIKEMGQHSTGIRFPMIVQDGSNEKYFHLFDGKDSSHRIKLHNILVEAPGESMRLNNIIQTYVIPEENFKRLPELVRSQIIYAEILLLEATAGGKKDRTKLEQAIFTYLKCLELLLNYTFIDHLKQEEGHRLFVTKDQPVKFLRSPLDRDKKNLLRLRDLSEVIELSQIKMLIDAPTFFNTTSLDYVFKNRKRFWEYCRIELRSTLKNESLIEIRNTLAKGESIDLYDQELILVRNILLGVGGLGVFNGIIQSYYSEEVQKEKVA
jgi:hypothetical protein